MANQYSNLPPLCDYFERYLNANKSEWSHHHYNDIKASLRRFENWNKLQGTKLEDVTWENLQNFLRFLNLNGTTTRQCSRITSHTKKAIRWGIDSGEMPQQMEDVYTSNLSVNKWDQELPKESKEFISHLEATLKGDSIRCHVYYHRIFHTFLTTKKLKYRQLKRDHIIDFIKFMGEKKMGQHTKCMTATKIRCYLRWLQEQGYIKRHYDEIFPSKLIPKKVTHLPRPLEPEVDMAYQKLLIETDDIIYKGILLLRRTGMRVKELMEMEFDCIETVTEGYKTIKVPPVKLYMERRVPVDPTTEKLIKLIQKKSIEYSNGKPPKFLMINTNGKRPEYAAYCFSNIEICSRLKVKKWINLHALRHTFATNLLNAGMSIMSLKEILGHKTIIMTLKYAKVTHVSIRTEYMKAITLMEKNQIAPILQPKSLSTNDLFNDITNLIRNKADKNGIQQTNKEFKSILNRLVKLKKDIEVL